MKKQLVNPHKRTSLKLSRVPCVFFIGGKTGGHLLPAIQLAHQLKSQGIRSFFICYNGSLDKDLLKKNGYSFCALSSYPPKNLLLFLFFGFISILCSSFLLFKHRPNLVVGLGGFPSFWGVLTSILWKKKTLILEQNRKLGQANRFLSRIVKNCIYILPLDEKDDSLFKGKKDLINLQKTAFVKPQKDLPSSLKVIGITGGSQGAVFLNQSIFFLQENLGKEYSFILLAGKKSYSEYQQKYQKISSVRVIDFCYDMASFYQKVDCVISRSGSGALNDILTYEVPNILVPYPYAGGHQVDNAYFFYQYGLSLMMEEKEGKKKLLYLIKNVFEEERKKSFIEKMKAYKQEFKRSSFCDLIKKEYL